MRFEEENMSLQKYFNLYKWSQEKISNEQIISDSLLNSLIKELRKKDVAFLVEMLIEGYFIESRKNTWKKQFLDKMNEIFFDDVEWKFDSISRVGYDEYGYSIYFKMNNQKYCLFMPNPKRLSIKTMPYAYYGRYNFTKEEKTSLWVGICTSYDAEEIKAAIKEENEVNANG